MVKNKNNQAIWNTRINKNVSSLFQKVGNSIDVDKRLYKEDIAASIVHVEMLFKQKIITFKVKNKIIYGLNKIEKENNCTWFISKVSKLHARKKWIISSIFPKGELVIDDGAKKALLNGKSLLAAGIKKVSGKFRNCSATFR